MTSTGATVKVTLKRSVIGRPKNQVETVKALGLKKIGDSRELADTPAIRGMIKTVQHLVEVEA
ncbi:MULTISPECIES: 50S ribosomal protein L30 [Deinococcus]|uniref:50S ribosomal protein L30 n=1 Tax=Deinococcus TaxID=1298 RepID=UPI000051CA3E|nr:MULTISPECIES: 50S ribosomal protein L30 [Deinococcus]ABF46144.1 ribosomal protein L30 [Deinococcus geothermalis DSM 11300]MBI0447054.1 50S ribosomal protein L30 [Deinococcus sp. DB0503]TDE85841.1 50S ribosomal protein L30 [Deinococcus sp. S9]